MIDALRHASSQITRTGITFVAACAYFGVTAGATNHAALLTGQTLAMPLLNAQLPVFPFYVVAPIILILLHLNFLMAQFFFRGKVERYRIDSGPGEPSLFDAFGVSLAPRALALHRGENRFTRNILLGVFLVVNVVLPLLVLFVLQAQVLPRHWSVMSDLYRWLITLDVALVVYIIPKIRLGTSWLRWWWPKRAPRREWAHAWLRPIVMATPRLLALAKRVVLLAILAVFVVCTWYLDDPSDPDAVPCERRVAFGFTGGWPQYHLDLSHGNFSVPSGLRLIDQDLRCADFEGVDLHGLDFSYSDLAGANFSRANLRFARFGVVATAPPARERDERKGTTAVGAAFRSADVREAFFDGVDLTETDFGRANGNGATFRGAELAGANLSGASLVSTVFDGAHVEMATLDDVRMLCASARGARFDLASLRRARLTAVDFLRSTADGADLERADLRFSSGLNLADQNLRGAHLWGACPVPETESRPDGRDATLRMKDTPVARGSNLRQVELAPVDARSWNELMAEASRVVHELDDEEPSPLPGIEPVASLLAPLCRPPAAGEDTDSGGPRAASDEPQPLGARTPPWRTGEPGPCFSAPPEGRGDFGQDNLLTAEDAERFRAVFGWGEVSESTPRDVAAVQTGWVDRFTSRCEKPRWMRALLARFFLLPNYGFDTVEEDLARALEDKELQGCDALDVALDERCREDPDGWNEAVTERLGTRPSVLKCTG